MRVSTKELRTRMRLLIDCIARVEEVIITYRGGDKAILSGLWEDRQDLENIEGYVNSLRAVRG